MAGLLFVFVDHGAGIRRATYLCHDCAKNVDKNWNITVSFIIHMNFDHAWAEHYPVSLKSGYWQMEMDPVDKEKAAFTTGRGLWQFKAIGTGLL